MVISLRSAVTFDLDKTLGTHAMPPGNPTPSPISNGGDVGVGETVLVGVRLGVVVALKVAEGVSVPVGVWVGLSVEVGSTVAVIVGVAAIQKPSFPHLAL